MKKITEKKCKPVDPDHLAVSIGNQLYRLGKDMSRDGCYTQSQLDEYKERITLLHASLNLLQ